MTRARLVVLLALALGAFSGFGVAALSQDASLTGCTDDQTSWTSRSFPDRTFQTAEEAVAATLEDVGIKTEATQITSAVEANEGLEPRAEELSFVVEPSEPGIPLVEVTILEVAGGRFAPGDMAWCAAS